LLRGSKKRHDATLAQEISARNIKRPSAFPEAVFVFTAYVAPACILGLFVLLAGGRLAGFRPATWLWFFLLGLVPTVLLCRSMSLPEAGGGIILA